jgi:hypothetical protein
VSGLELLAEAAHAAGVGVLLGADPENRLECALQMKRALAEFCAEIRQRQWFIEMLLNVSAHRFHELLVRVAGDSFWAAAQAFPESRSLRFLWMNEETHVLPLRPSRRAGWPAVHARR